MTQKGEGWSEALTAQMDAGASGVDLLTAAMHATKECVKEVHEQDVAARRAKAASGGGTPKQQASMWRQILGLAEELYGSRYHGAGIAFCWEEIY